MLHAHGFSVGIVLLVPCAGFSGPKEWDSSNRYPAFFMVCREKSKMLQSGFGYLTGIRGKGKG